MNYNETFCIVEKEKEVECKKGAVNKKLILLPFTGFVTYVTMSANTMNQVAAKQAFGQWV